MILRVQPVHIYQMYIRIHRSAGCHEVVGICDHELLGKTLSEGDLNVVISPEFFGSHLATEEEILAALRDCENINMFGERCISLAISHGFIDEDSCRMIAGVPHAIIL
ncbi:DUF424 domain-containing protein [Methanospirillum lacunae]|uniref:DUF424 domain-containing protein n=2 Tax=Methanospirillum lacunae TaxID=668570 RepID=A0A2V2N8R4_9EURY|nr:DUF424 domain-containing protein [Methanospirillum lacunae]PWR74056.1 DUF424 domain-containing protein [Methanospirillum lacunae]